MLFRSYFLFVALSSSIVSADNSNPRPSEGPWCVPAGHVDRVHDKFHSDASCNKLEYNAFRDSMNRHLAYQRLKNTQTHSLVPLERTVTCPPIVTDLYEPNQVTGYDAVWIVENTASSPIVISYYKQGVGEFSVNNIRPPQADPKAIVQPGEYKVVHTFEGHVFHARELLKNGGVGDVLLQHRVGVIPIGKNKQAQELVCDTTDIEPIVEKKRAPEYKRTDPPVLQNCHQLSISFRNMSPCPLHGYFVQPTYGGQCTERFKFHLGLHKVVKDFAWDWHSFQKIETSFLAHSFVFRSANGDLVDSVTLEPTRVTDCPKQKQRSMVAVSPDGLALDVGHGLLDPTNNSSSMTLGSLYNTTSYSNNRGGRRGVSFPSRSNSTASSAAYLSGLYSL